MEKHGRRARFSRPLGGKAPDPTLLPTSGSGEAVDRHDLELFRSSIIDFVSNFASTAVLGAIRKETEALRAEHAAKLREWTDELRAEHAEGLVERTRAIERAVERQARQAASERAVETSTLLSNAVRRISKREEKKVEEEVRRQVEAAERWQARLTESLERKIEDALEASTRLLVQRIEEAIAERHQELGAALERAVSTRAEEAEAGRDKRAESAVSEIEERLTATFASNLQSLTEKVEAQLTNQASALEQANQERWQEAERRRAEDLAAFLAAGEERVKHLAEELRSAIADAAREARRASDEGARYVDRLRSLATDEIPSDTNLAGDAKGAPLDANAATVDDLRGLDLSLTQATRMISHRDALGGFRSLEQLDDVPGISKKLRISLKRRLSIPAQP